MATFPESHTVTVTIERDAGEVYEFVSNPENMPQWAKAFCRSIERDDSGWTVHMPSGEVGLRFADQNPFGICDHYVTVGPGIEIYIPMRVIENGTGAEVIFTLFRQGGISAEAYEEDRRMVERDLGILKSVLEQRI